MTGRTLFIAEPPSSYLVRAPMVVDCSLLAAIVFAEPNRDDAVRLTAGKSLHAPYLIDHEMASVALKKQMAGLPPEALGRALGDYAEQAVTLHRTAVAEQADLAVRYQLSAYDAAYLWLAAELRVPLATFDRRLGAAARKHLGALPS